MRDDSGPSEIPKDAASDVSLPVEETQLWDLASLEELSDDEIIKKTLLFEPEFVKAYSSSSESSKSADECSGWVDRFEVEDELGHGAMGRVVRAWDANLSRHVAIKVLYHGDSDQRPTTVSRFIREGRILAKLEHPGIAAIHELGWAGEDRPYFAMRLVTGETLNKILASRNSDRSDVPRLLSIFEKICQTMAYVHSQKVIHRDLKPANIMLSDFGVVKVVDWGLAKQLNDPTHDDSTISDQFISDRGELLDDIFATQHGTVMGTIAYLPPEQARGLSDKVDERSDVFSLGGILCEILTGSAPYFFDDTKRAFRRAMAGDVGNAYKRLERCNQDERLIDLTKRCLNFEQDERPNDAGEVAQELTGIIESRMQQAEQDLVRFFDLSLDLFCIAGLDGYFRRLNDNFSLLLGYDEAELLATPFIEFIHPDDHAATISAVQQLDSGESLARFRNRYHCKDGSWVVLEWTSKSIPEEGLIYAVARDVSDPVTFES